MESIEVKKQNHLDREFLFKLYDETIIGKRGSIENYYKSKKFYTSTILAVIGSSTCRYSYEILILTHTDKLSLKGWYLILNINLF